MKSSALVNAIDLSLGSGALSSVASVITDVDDRFFKFMIERGLEIDRGRFDDERSLLPRVKPRLLDLLRLVGDSVRSLILDSRSTKSRDLRPRSRLP